MFVSHSLLHNKYVLSVGLFTYLLGDEGERVVVVTHGGVIRSLHERARPSARKVEKILNTSVNVFRLFDGEKWTIQVWGDVSHLDQTGFLQSGFGGDRTSG